MSNEKTPVKISLATLKKQVEEGMKRKELAEYYGIPETQMAKALKSAGLKIRKFHNPAFELVMEAEETQVEEAVGVKETIEVPPFWEDTVEDTAVEEPVFETEETEEVDNSPEISESFNLNPLNY